MKRSFLLLLILLKFNQASSQGNDMEGALYNVVLGSVTSGVGAIINDDKGEKWHKRMFKGMWQGALGGYIVFESKRTLRLMVREKEWEYAIAAKLLNAAGTSMIENASLNRNFYDKWHLTIGFLRLEFDTTDKFTFQPKVMPVSFYHTIYVATQSKFSPTLSLRTGELIFTTTSPRLLQENNGIIYGNTIVLHEDLSNDYALAGHEIAHSYQNNDFNVFNTYLNKPREIFTSKYPVFKAVDKWVFLDVHSILFQSAYYVEGLNNDCYFDNYFEHEAGYYSNTLNCP